MIDCKAEAEQAKRQLIRFKKLLAETQKIPDNAEHIRVYAEQIEKFSKILANHRRKL